MMDHDNLRPTLTEQVVKAKRAVVKKEETIKLKTKLKIHKWHLFQSPKKQSEVNNGTKDVYNLILHL